MKVMNMEEKQLNFNQPLLSVRRGSSISVPHESQRKNNNPDQSFPPLPFYKSELKSGPVRNPGVVPFKWEYLPGRPKDENKARKKDTLKWLPSSPKLPPGRIVNHMRKQTHQVLRDSPTALSRCQAENVPHSLEISSPDKVLSEVEGSEKEKEENYISSSEDENVTYEDARETLSTTESFFNCSASGVSGLDGPESAGAFSDPQSRDFMMGRFLPAAKAVASENPPFASRRHPVAREQAKPTAYVVKLKQSPRHYSIPDTMPHAISEEGKDDSDGPEESSVKLCGLLPKFCLMNPIPGMRDHAEVTSSVRSVRTRPVKGTKLNSMLAGTKYDRGGMKKKMVGEKNTSSQLFLDKEKQFLRLPGEPRDLSVYLQKKNHTKLEFAAPHDTENPANDVSPVEEKTLYVDSERMVESRHSNSSSSESRGRNPSIDYSLQDIKSVSRAEVKAIPHSKRSGSADSSTLSTSEKSCQDVSEDMKSLQRDNHDLNLIVVKQPLKPDIRSTEHNENCSSPLVLTPLLPKSPSESWLSRTLPSMSLRNQSYLASHDYRELPVDPKRERLLKASTVQNMFRPAGELTPILEN